MPLTIQSLNADSTFLLTFTAPPDAPDANPFTILIDPWLLGSSRILHPRFALTTHRTKPAISDLSELPGGPPDIVLISQAKTDHCHENTLRQLPADSDKTTVYAHPAAVKKINRWRHFPRHMVRPLPEFDAADPATVLRVPIVPKRKRRQFDDSFAVNAFGDIPPRWSRTSGGQFGGGGAAGYGGVNYGEVTLTLIPARRDVTGLHNAIGITYRAAQTSGQVRHDSANASILSTPPLSQRPPRIDLTFPLSPPLSPEDFFAGDLFSTNDFSIDLIAPKNKHLSMSSISLPAPVNVPLSPISISSGGGGGPGRPQNREEKILSVLYTPHGVSPGLLIPYKEAHLRPLSALPLTVLLHPFDIVRNPKLLGGTITSGAKRGAQVAQAMDARLWVGAHDGDKINKGISVKGLTVRRFDMSEVQDFVNQDPISAATGRKMQLLRLGAGEFVTT